MKKINTLLNLDEKKLKELEEKIKSISIEGNNIDGAVTYVDFSILEEILYQILSSTANLEISLKMLKVALKFVVLGAKRNEEAVALVIDYYCINKLGFFKTELEEMIK